MDEVFFPQNNARVARQKETDIRVIIGNPPYSVGQAVRTTTTRTWPIRRWTPGSGTPTQLSHGRRLKRNLYDSYIRAFRWASDRIKDQGVVCFVSNGAFIDSGSADGFRKSLGR